MDALTFRFSYRPALDGMRGLAVVLVVLSHSVRHTEGGGIGVQMFFTLSGFLITSLLLDERARTGYVSLPNFYARRALRLLPPLLIMLALVAALPNVYRTPLDGHSMSRLITIPLALFYMANFGNIYGEGMGYLAHCWSLSVEEQFYIVWPVVALGLLRRGRLRQYLPWLIGGFITLRTLMTVTGIGDNPDWPTAQADGLLIGAWLACVLSVGLPSRWTSRRAGWGGLGALLLLTLVGSATHQGMQGRVGLYGGLTVCGLASAALIGHLAAGDGSLVALFRWWPAVLTGRVSYGVYLFHFPIFQYFAHERWSQSKTLAIEYPVAALAVIASWFLIERPCLKLKRRYESDRTTTASLVDRTTTGSASKGAVL